VAAVNYTATELSKLLGVTARRVGQLRKEGVLKRRRDGRYMPSAITAYIEYLRARGRKKTGFDTQIAEEKLRRLRRENDEAEACLAPVSVLGDALRKVVAVWVPLLEGVPLALKRQLPSLTGDEIATVKAIIAEARNAIADAEINLDE
jgi:phage terminase Nu1 subunit (DNA packaging protein)